MDKTKAVYSKVRMLNSDLLLELQRNAKGCPCLKKRDHLTMRNQLLELANRAQAAIYEGTGTVFDPKHSKDATEVWSSVYRYMYSCEHLYGQYTKVNLDTLWCIACKEILANIKEIYRLAEQGEVYWKEDL